MEITEQTKKMKGLASDKAKYNRYITRRLILYIVFFSSFITLVITASQLYGEYKDGIEGIEDQFSQMRVLSLPGLTENLWNLYEKQIQIQLDDLMQHPDLQYLEIRYDGKILASSGLYAAENTISETIPIIYHQGNERIDIGELLVMASLERIYEEIIDRTMVILVSNAFKTALVSIFMFCLFQFLVTRHLVTISEYLQSFSPGQIDTRPSLNRRPIQDELQQVVDTIHEMAAKLNLSVVERERAEKQLLRNERLAAIGELTATVSHELRNPLGALRTSVATIKKVGGDLPPIISSSIAIADRSVTRCDRIISDLLDYSRLRPLELNTMEFDKWLGDLLDEYVLPPGIELRRDLESGARLSFDNERIRQAVLNLLENACQAMTEAKEAAAGATQGQLAVATRSIGNRLELSVSDTGSGVSPEDIERVFEPLQSTKTFGVGLGLPIVQQIAKQHHGRVELTSEVGRGTRVVVSLPLSVEEYRTAS